MAFVIYTKCVIITQLILHTYMYMYIYTCIILTIISHGYGAAFCTYMYLSLDGNHDTCAHYKVSRYYSREFKKGHTIGIAEKYKMR